jgi:hypothetical protein
MTNRLHYWDALRVFAMLVGIVFHVVVFSLPKSSSYNSVLEVFAEATHGFRMQLFFLVSGFFSAMLWQRRGIHKLAQNRLQRVFIPLVLGVLTINPLFEHISRWAMQRSSSVPQGMVQAILHGEQARISQLLESGVDPNGRDPKFGIPLLTWAALKGDLPRSRPGCGLWCRGDSSPGSGLNGRRYSGGSASGAGCQS